MKTFERNDWWMVLAVLVCLAGSVPRGIGEPVPEIKIEANDCWFGQFEERLNATISESLTQLTSRWRVLPLIDRH